MHCWMSSILLKKNQKTEKIQTLMTSGLLYYIYVYVHMNVMKEKSIVGVYIVLSTTEYDSQKERLYFIARRT